MLEGEGLPGFCLHFQLMKIWSNVLAPHLSSYNDLRFCKKHCSKRCNSLALQLATRLEAFPGSRNLDADTRRVKSVIKVLSEPNKSCLLVQRKSLQVNKSLTAYGGRYQLF